MSSIQAMIDRAASDPDFLKRLAKDPVGTADGEGYNVSFEEVKAMLGMPEASDREVVEALQARLSHIGKGAGLIGNTGAA